MDHYKELGVNRTASKGEIKDAFRKLALLYHPDRHSHSPSSVRDTATFKFKRISEAYDVLSDDRKRADYNLRSSSSNSSSFRSRGSYGYRNDYSYDYSSRGRGFNGGGTSASSAFETAARFFTTRAFRLNLAFAVALCAGAVVMDQSRGALWNMQNSGKSFEDAMESIEKAKAQRYP